jgi:hypothetical protein
MYMKYFLSRVLIAIGYQSVARGIYPLFFGDDICRRSHLREHPGILRGHVRQLLDVAPGYYHDMHRRLRLYIIERDDLVVLVYEFRAYLFGGYLAEYTIIARHLTRPL